jgi:hypothetical protein
MVINKNLVSCHVVVIHISRNYVYSSRDALCCAACVISILAKVYNISRLQIVTHDDDVLFC